ncbi:Pentapeptide repeat-containing protein [Halogranum rubrum]|uniref:Pentapeptide repeat-containing protein n=2 Tax=Halogranum rubrum TaxID=553466 RepID=A0A1I4B6L7_9EURY|nr:pentapeptide repeat-containing protein [Halogranum rubrum]SFK64010.1 Pentapeptide repeat-containing protein [Halogranum rubrum]
MSATCRYTFDPSTETDAGLQTTWECPHEPHPDSDHCVFHMSRDERAACDVRSEDIVESLRANLQSPDTRVNEYVGADLPHLSFTYQDVNGATNHVLNFRHADIEGLDFTHGRLDQGLILQEATVGRLKFEDATVTGDVEADEVTVRGDVTTDEATFQQDVHFDGAVFQGDVDCDETTFQSDTTFRGATFQGIVHFRNVETNGSSHVLDDHLSFADATFRDDASFRQATFDYVTFEGTQFTAGSDFEHATFEGDARFDGATFQQMADFDEARFADDVSFADVRFVQLAEFRGVEFRGGSRTTNDDVTFEGAVFEREADYKLAKFRYADFKDVAFKGPVNFDRATFTARADCHRVQVDGEFDLVHATFEGEVDFTESSFGDDVVATEATFDGDVTFEHAAFDRLVRFDEARFNEDASFRGATFHGMAAFRGTVFEGEARHLEENASFDEADFHDSATFEAANFTNVSFRETTFQERCDFRQAAFHETATFRLLGGDRDTYVDLTDATIDGGTISQVGGSAIPYDLTRATVGDLQLEGEGNEHELLDSFRFCLTDFDHFDFSNHHAYLERNDWTIHDFTGNEATGQFAVEMTNEIVEETYRKAQDSADAVGDTPASREFEFKHYYYNRKKNLDIILNEYSLNAWGRGKKAASVGLNLFMQVTCGYGNRLPRIAAFTFLLPALFGLLYAFGGPFLTQAGSVLDPGAVDKTALEVLFDNVYYSYISFSTVGYGDINPLGAGARVLAASQGMLNGLFFTLLTFTLFKRVLGGS